jgi:hypothetical protein
MAITRASIIRALASSAILGVVAFQSQPALAKLDVPYGEDGSPPDSETQAEVDALNDALDGPDDGESTEHWEARLQYAHETLYGYGIDLDGGATGTGGSSSTGNTPVSQGTDLCESPLGDWLSFDEETPPPVSSEVVANALDDPSVRSDLKRELANLAYIMMRIEPVSADAIVGTPSVGALSCTLGESHVTIRIPLTLVEFGLSLGSGTLTVDATASFAHHKVDDWCLDVNSYAVTGFEPITRALIMPSIARTMSNTPFCLPAFGAAYAVTYSGSG